MAPNTEYPTGLSPRGRGNPVSTRRDRLPARSIPAWAGKPRASTRPVLRPAVYPRVGGETRARRRPTRRIGGLSPRGRGNLLTPASGDGKHRSIPAWAGKPLGWIALGEGLMVYPRVGGETGVYGWLGQFPAGLSPRGRGNRRRHRGCRPRDGSIPAWAGKPRRPRPMAGSMKVYPRVGGETLEHLGHQPTGRGLSPRGRGNRGARPRGADPKRSIPAWAGKPQRPAGDLDAQVLGLSPRGRGNRPRVLERCASSRSIPAWAGKPEAQNISTAESRGLSPRGRGNHHGRGLLAERRRSIPAWAGKPHGEIVAEQHVRVYPRVGGETGKYIGGTLAPVGLSPRGRGNREGRVDRDDDRRSIPAWAGKPCDGACQRTSAGVYPRVGGETRIQSVTIDSMRGLSPRGRGNLPHPVDRAPGTGSIPAWAGKPRGVGGIAAARQVYPRVGGETGLEQPQLQPAQGLSPRGRGNPSLLHHAEEHVRSIPAWAGKPASRSPGRGCHAVYPRVGGETCWQPRRRR